VVPVAVDLEVPCMPAPAEDPAGAAAPLQGLRVVSLAVNLPGPLACARLRELGADVTKVEPPAGDPLRQYAPQWYAELAVGQRVVTLDLRDASGRARLEDLLEGADLLLTSVRPSAAARLGLPEAVRRHRLAHVEIVGGAGRAAEVPGHDLTYQAAHGLLQPPHNPAALVADTLGAERAVSAAMLAWGSLARGHEPPHVRVSLEEAAAAAAAGLRHGLTAPDGLLGGGLPGYGIYATADGHVAVAALEPQFAAALAEHVGRTREELAAAFAGRTTAEWEALATGHDLPITGLRTAYPEPDRRSTVHLTAGSLSPADAGEQR
jgi:alpha-methylacyl-CoA racemase